MVKTRFKTTKAKKPKPLSKENILSDTEIKTIKGVLKTPEENLTFLTLLYTGMRINEFIHCSIEWMDFEEGFINIPPEQKCNCNECKRHNNTWTPKTKSSIRSIIVLPEIKELLESYFSNFKKVSDLVKHRVYAWQVLKKVEKKTKLKHRLFPHCLRATFASILASKGFSELEITQILGWTSIEPAKHYIKFSKNKIKKSFQQKW